MTCPPSSAEPALPSPAPGMHRFGWYGLSLILPDSWNLIFHTGTFAQGALIFSDLSARQFEVRWRTPRRFRFLRQDPQRALKRLVSRLEHGHKVQALPQRSSAYRLARDGGVLVLAADTQRLYELSWSQAGSFTTDNIALITADFLQSMEALALCPSSPWSVYGAYGWLPKTARLRRCSLLPGASQLIFTVWGGRSTLGACSLADRLLANRSLKAWAIAAIPFFKSNPAGHWEETSNCARFRYESRAWRPFPRVSSHILTVQHDPTANRIYWTHHVEKVMTGMGEF